MTPAQKSIVQYAKMVAKAAEGDPYGNFMSSLMQEGSWFEGMEPAANDPETKAWQRLHRPKKKECFYNAQQFVIDISPKAKYFEGLCWQGVMPVDHAWIVFKGQVIDFTLEAMMRAIKRIKGVDLSKANVAPVYLGLPVPMKFFASVIAVDGVSDSVAPLYYALKGKKRKKGKG